MTAAAIIAIILIGLILIFLEVFLVPGTTLFGIIGGVAVVAGVAMVYGYFGRSYGHLALAISTVAILLAVVLGFKVVQSNRLAMKAEIESRVNEEDLSMFNAGDEGTALTDLRPNGKALFAQGKTEVFSLGEFINRGTRVQIVKISGNKIYVQPLNT